MFLLFARWRLVYFEPIFSLKTARPGEVLLKYRENILSLFSPQVRRVVFTSDAVSGSLVGIAEVWNVRPYSNFYSELDLSAE